MPKEVQHSITYSQSPVSGLFRATCACSWWWIGDRQSVHRHALAHEAGIEWVPVDHILPKIKVDHA